MMFHHSSCARGVLAVLAVTAAAPLATPRTAGAQAGPGPMQEESTRRGVSYRLGLGPSAFWGSEGNPVGVQGTAAAEYRPGRSPLSLRLEASYNRFGVLEAYPCILRDTSGCYDTSQRATTGAAVGAVYHVTPARRARPGLYVLAGAGVYASRRVATRYPNCADGQVCAAEAARTTYRDTDPGLHVGGGADFAAGGWPVFVEFRWHVIRPGGQGRASARDTRFADFSLIPVTVGVRF